MSEQRRSAVSKFIATEQLARQRNAAPAARSAAQEKLSENGPGEGVIPARGSMLAHRKRRPP
jgi:hypothetical protein